MNVCEVLGNKLKQVFNKIIFDNQLAFIIGRGIIDKAHDPFSWLLSGKSTVTKRCVCERCGDFVVIFIVRIWERNNPLESLSRRYNLPIAFERALSLQVPTMEIPTKIFTRTTALLVTEPYVLNNILLIILMYP